MPSSTDKTSLAIRQYEKLLKEKVFAIRPFDDAHPNLFLINYVTLFRAREPRPAELLFDKRLGEYYFYQQAVQQRLPLPTPNILFYVPRGSLKVEPYLDGPLCEKGIPLEEALRVIEALALLHQFKLEGHEFDPLEHLYHYKKLAKNTLPASFEESLIHKMETLRGAYPLVLSHNDVKNRHIVFHEGKAFLLDFSSAGENAPIFDLASFFLDADISPDHIRSCLEHYQRLSGGRTYLYQDVYDAMSFLCVYDYYHYSALAQGSDNPFYAMEAKNRKAQALRRFEDSLL